MNLIFQLAIALFLTSSGTDRKVRLIYIDILLRDAIQVKTIIVSSFTDTSMMYSDLSGKKSTVQCKHREASEEFRKNLIKSKYISDNDLAGLWPRKGDTVLAVFTKANKIEVFAKKIGRHYRFWDPNSIPFSNSIFIFPSTPPYFILPICKQLMAPSDNYTSCEDGCLIDQSAIKERG